MPIPDVRCTKRGRLVPPPTEEKAGPFHTHAALIWLRLFFARAYAISFTEICETLHHLMLNLDRIKDKKNIDYVSLSEHAEVVQDFGAELQLWRYFYTCKTI